MLQWRERLYHFLFHLLYTFHLLLVLLGLVRSCQESRDEYCGFKGYPSIQRVKRAGAWLVRLNFKSWKNEVLTVRVVREGAAGPASRIRRRQQGGESRTRVRGSSGAQEDFQNLPLRAQDAWSGGDWMLSKTANRGCTVGMGVGKGSQVWFHQILLAPHAGSQVIFPVSSYRISCTFSWKIILSIKIGASPQALSNLMSLHFQLTLKGPWGPE